MSVDSAEFCLKKAREFLEMARKAKNDCFSAKTSIQQQIHKDYALFLIEKSRIMCDLATKSL